MSVNVTILIKIVFFLVKRKRNRYREMSVATGTLLKINAEALLKYSTPQRTATGWNRPKLSGRQFNVLKKNVERNMNIEWPLPEPEKKLLPERPSKLTILQRTQPLREKKINEALKNMPKLLADKMKASRDKKKKETENSISALMPGFVKGGPYPSHITGEVAALKKQAAIEKEKKIADFIAQSSKKGKAKK
ncbi:hypothetical protein PPL_11097 [Heterostelium album PN500]|uniref:Uncharacterized protein n=1 Tax=Heterostelium pallidum (strain ATCC 26659 / Pp 5 / PN500) TaxID=670386 RepID=D3BSX7_HETP5|nr:hypothetical protein PPL_11097 [Heterostelium album PN500]EFA75592.1 hypothetical protein PPL_11097 [Heterostelium album PN500]|eukprot:XP_020427726.1 hypothetical protein PPL_11097 [Heterostelium album PN500]